MSILNIAIFLTLTLGLDNGHLEDHPGKSAPTPIADQYQNSAKRILDATLAGNEAWDKMEQLCLLIGNRISGSPQLEKAIDWAIDAMKKDDQENCHREKVMVPRWVRGRESATILKPRVEAMHMLGLGLSVRTPPEGVTGEVVVVADEEEFEAMGDKIRGKIVLFNNPMPAYDPEKGAGYGTTVRFRGKGATMSAAKGAVACLVRSVTAYSLRTPHTGAMRYGDAKVKIPAAAISTEDAEMIARLTARGVPVTVKLNMEAKTMPDSESGNVIGELRGSTWPNEVVVIGGHIDSWDVGQGATDDGGGCVIAMEAINVLRKLKLRPKRTIRVVLWTNEENGLRGAKAYAQQHADELKDHVAAIESDSGVFAPRGYSLECNNEDKQSIAARQMRDIITLLEPIGATRLTLGGSGADVSPMGESGVVLMGHHVEGSKYFNYHHTHADTLDKIDPVLLSQNVAAIATVAYIIADMPQRLGTEAE